jgi:hypothetical protein
MLGFDHELIGFGLTQADVTAADLKLDETPDVDAAHHAHESSGQESELHQASAETAVAPDLDQAGATAGRKLA